MDTSALAKMVVAEAESEALQSHLRSRATTLTTSQIGAIELTRSARRLGISSANHSHALLASIEIAQLNRAIAQRAANLGPATLRTLDAIHVATAIELRVDVVITYDQRMLEACEANGLEVAAPGVG